MSKSIKMVGMDLDGTLLTTNKKLTDYTRNVLEKAVEQGCVVLPATGRPFTALPKEVLDIPGIKYAVTANGARIVEIESQKTIYENLLSIETAGMILDVMKDYHVTKEIFVDGVGYTDAETMRNLALYFKPASVEYMRQTRTPTEDIKATLYQLNKPVDKVQGLFHNEEDKKEAAKRLEQIPGIVVTSALGYNLEANSVGASKGLALLKLGELLGIEKEEIMACGDGTNDSEMLQTVGFGVAMANGMKEVKEIADYVTESNDEDGVAKAIERFVLR